MKENWISSSEIPKVKIDAVACIRKDTNRFLCELKDTFSKTEEEKWQDIIQEARSIQEYLSKNAEIENNDNFILVLKSPEWKYFKVNIPKSFRKTQEISFNIWWKKINLVADPITNGYNTEYIINNWQSWRKQIAVFYPVTNPDWKKIKDKIDELKNEKKELEIKKAKLESIVQREQISLSLEKSKLKKSPKDTKQLKKVKDLERTIYANWNILKDIPRGILELWKKIKPLELELWKFDQFTSFAYSPYHKDFDTQWVRSHWFSYLDKNTKDSFSKINWEKSLVWWDKKMLVKEAFTHDIATVLNIVERMDYHIYSWKTPQQVQDIMDQQINKALTTIWLNQDDSFNRQRSNVWALWLWQFMPLTYNNLVKNYPDTFKEKYPFEKWAKDHSTTFRLQALHFHEETRAFPKWIRDNWNTILRDEEAKLWLYALIAAGYNWSVKRVITEAQLWDKLDLSLLHPTKLIENLKSNRETQTYVMKFVYTYKHLSKTYRTFW